MKISFNMLVVLLVIISVIISTLAWIALSNYGIVVPTSEGNKSEQKFGQNKGGIWEANLNL